MIELTLEGYDLWVAGVHDIVLRISDVSSSSKRDDARRSTFHSLLRVFSIILIDDPTAVLEAHPLAASQPSSDDTLTVIGELGSRPSSRSLSSSRATRYTSIR